MMNQYIQIFELVCAILSLPPVLAWFAPRLVRGYQNARNWCALRSVKSISRRIDEIDYNIAILVEIKDNIKSIGLIIYSLKILSLQIVIAGWLFSFIFINGDSHNHESNTLKPLLLFIIQLLPYIIISLMCRWANPNRINKNIKILEKMKEKLAEKLESKSLSL